MSEAEQTAPTPETEAEHVRAARLIREKFSALGIVAVFGAPTPAVGPAAKAEPGSYHTPQPWPHVHFAVMYTRPPRAASISTEYRIGTGCAPWKNPRVKAEVGRAHFGKFSHNAAWYVAERECGIRGSKRHRPEIEAEAAAIACTVAKWTPDPAEVFANICRDGFDARDQSFEDWAEDFGYDADSRKAETVWNACRKCWTDALRIVSAEDAQEFAELAGQL